MQEYRRFPPAATNEDRRSAVFPVNPIIVGLLIRQQSMNDLRMYMECLPDTIYSNRGHLVLLRLGSMREYRLKMQVWPQGS